VQDLTLFDEITEQELESIGGGDANSVNLIITAPSTGALIRLQKIFSRIGDENK
jgi:hypothetical protein